MHRDGVNVGDAALAVLAMRENSVRKSPKSRGRLHTLALFAGAKRESVEIVICVRGDITQSNVEPRGRSHGKCDVLRILQFLDLHHALRFALTCRMRYT